MKMQEIEIEFKNLLTKAEYEKLFVAFPFPREAVRQTNYYFETKDFALKQQGAALRIREKEGKFRFTLKEPYGDGLLETHDLLSAEEAEQILSGRISFKEHTGARLERLGIQPEQLQIYGPLITERREQEAQGVLLVLDRSLYNSHEDLEFELEAPDYQTGLSVFNEILETHQISRKATPNKIERFFATLGTDGRA